MKKTFLSWLLIPLILLAYSAPAEAKCGRALNNKSIEELDVFTGAPATGDYIPICDTSANTMKKTDASNLTLGGAFNGTVGATTPSTGAFTTITASSTINKVTVTAPATGSTLTIPDGVTFTGPAASGTAATLAGSETLSNKTETAPVVNNPVITGPAPVACGGTCTLGAANKGTYTRLDTAAGSVATLPTATGSGTVYRLYVSVANSSNSDKILLATVTDTIIGTAIGENAGTAKVFVGNAGTYHSIQMPFAGTQPSGGFIGDTVVCTDVASTIWKCDVNYQAGTTPTTPYSASTT